jgi:hypothetical protein
MRPASAVSKVASDSRCPSMEGDVSATEPAANDVIVRDNRRRARRLSCRGMARSNAVSGDRSGRCTEALDVEAFSWCHGEASWRKPNLPAASRPRAGNRRQDVRSPVRSPIDRGVGRHGATARVRAAGETAKHRNPAGITIVAHWFRRRSWMRAPNGNAFCCGAGSPASRSTSLARAHSSHGCATAAA